LSATPHPDEASRKSELDKAVEETISEAHLRADTLAQAEREYLKEHALKRPLQVRHIWALGVGVVITGEYFGWNTGLREGGPVGMLLASLFVCALYMAWVLALSELSVAMPLAGGPLAYGRRAFGPAFGFLMGWSMFLECLFATIGTAIATGGAVFFLIDLVWPAPAGSNAEDYRLLLTTIFGLATVVLFGVIQWLGAKEQAKVMTWMTYGAIAGLVWFWIACLPGVDIERVLTEPLLVNGWEGAIKAIPFAIWWLVIIESVALAAEEAHEPHRTLPRGLVLAQLTLIALVILTWFFVSAATRDYRQTAEVSYPLQQVYQEVWPGSEHYWQLIPFAVIALCGMVASYNGMIYAVSRQSFSLGRAGYLPRFLGRVHPERRTPDVSIFIWSVVIAAFVVWGYYNSDAVTVAVLTCNLTALVWYVLAMICLFRLRYTEPSMPRPYKVPFYPYLPALVLSMSLFAAGVYGWLNEPIVLWITLVLYAVGMGYHFLIARRRLVSAAPEELAARGLSE
jgi:ethanolamine permease